MTSTEAKPYLQKSIPALLKIAEKHFNKFIRERDKDEPCINCGNYRTLQAGHFFPKTISALRFNEDNVNGECLHCNYYDSQSHAYKYRVNLIKKIGAARFENLVFLSLTRGHKWDRFNLIEIILKYK